MFGRGQQQKNRVFVSDQFEGMGKAFRFAVKFRAELSEFFAILLDLSFPAGHLFSAPAEKEFALQIAQSDLIPCRQPVLLRKRIGTTHLSQRSGIKSAASQLAV